MKQRRTIYLVDDDEDDRMLIREALESVIKDVQIKELIDGSELLTQIKHDDPDEPALILMDMNMPRLNGLEALSLLKTDPDFQHIPVVMVSTTRHQDTISKAYEKGVNAFVVKPVKFNDYIRLAQAVDICFLNNYLTDDQTFSIKQTEVSKRFKGKSLLLIEDNTDHASLIQLFLKQVMPDVKIFHSDNDESALDFLVKSYDLVKLPVELIILDLYLPARKLGLDLLDKIRNFFTSQQVPPVPIVVLSASDQQQDIKASYQRHANAYMVKSKDPVLSFSYLSEVCQFWWDTTALPH